MRGEGEVREGQAAAEGDAGSGSRGSGGGHSGMDPPVLCDALTVLPRPHAPARRPRYCFHDPPPSSAAGTKLGVRKSLRRGDSGSELTVV